jgi:hypothetical protein
MMTRIERMTTALDENALGGTAGELAQQVKAITDAYQTIQAANADLSAAWSDDEEPHTTNLRQLLETYMHGISATVLTEYLNLVQVNAHYVSSAAPAGQIPALYSNALIG